MWTDGNWDYFVTSDGYLYRVRRDSQRDAMEEAFRLRMMGWEALNQKLALGVWMFVVLDVLVLAILIGGTR